MKKYTKKRNKKYTYKYKKKKYTKNKTLLKLYGRLRYDKSTFTQAIENTTATD